MMPGITLIILPTVFWLYFTRFDQSLWRHETHEAKGLCNTNNSQILDEVEPNIMIFQWRADQLFAEAEGGQILDLRDTGKHDILRQSSSRAVLFFGHQVCFHIYVFTNI